MVTQGQTQVTMSHRGHGKGLGLTNARRSDITEMCVWKAGRSPAMALEATGATSPFLLPWPCLARAILRLSHDYFNSSGASCTTRLTAYFHAFMQHPVHTHLRTPLEHTVTNVHA